MKSCNNKRRVNKAEYCAEDYLEWTCNSCKYYSGDHISDLPANGPRIKCAAITARRRLQNGTTIMDTT